MIRVLARAGTALTVAAMALSASPGPAAAAGICDGVVRCKVVARRDVDGDGLRDLVARVRRQQSVLVRVQLHDGQRMQRRLDTSIWGVQPWYGAAGLDGVRGAELVVRTVLGAHTEFFTVLTCRGDRLRVLRAPGGSRTWVVDGSYSTNIGVYRRRSDRHVFVKVRSAVRDSSGHGHHGRDVTYRWKRGQWVKVASRKRHYARDRAAFRIAGWHIRPLPRF